jgi:hypothetical protein
VHSGLLTASHPPILTGGALPHARRVATGSVREPLERRVQQRADGGGGHNDPSGQGQQHPRSRRLFISREVLVVCLHSALPRPDPDRRSGSSHGRCPTDYGQFGLNPPSRLAGSAAPDGESGVKGPATPVDIEGMPDKIEELVERMRTIEQQLERIMRHLPEPAPAADQTVAEGAIDLTAEPAPAQTAGISYP